jgi:Phytanoyl-CoA dioxygenase (PhyH)
MAHRLVNDLTYSRWFAWLVHYPAVYIGSIVFRSSGRTPWFSYWSMRRLYCITRSRFNRRFSGALERTVEMAETAAVDRNSLEKLRRDGYVVLPRRLDEATCDALLRLARSTPAHLVPRPAAGPEQARFDPEAPQAIKYDLPETALLEDPAVQRLLVDESLYALASAYLGCQPINDLVAMWWSTAHSREANSEVAQLYHFDMDRLRFLKIFFYLTDVTAETGPHCYIRGSHVDRPPQFWRDGRHEDAAVREACGADKEVLITGPRGTILAVDTSGFHKGLALTRGERLILQFEFTNSLFGAEYLRPRVSPNDFWRRELQRRPHYLQRVVPTPEA